MDSESTNKAIKTTTITPQEWSERRRQRREEALLKKGVPNTSGQVISAATSPKSGRTSSRFSKYYRSSNSTVNTNKDIDTNLETKPYHNNFSAPTILTVEKTDSIADSVLTDSTDADNAHKVHSVEEIHVESTTTVTTTTELTRINTSEIGLTHRRPSLDLLHKNLYFILHGECEKHIFVDTTKGALQQLLHKGKFPMKQQLGSLQTIFTKDHLDTKLSSFGQEECREMKNILIEENFWKSVQPCHILCSPYGHVLETCKLLLENENTKFEILECLKEASSYETKIYASGLDERIHIFEQYLKQLPYENIVIFGHSLYFQKLLHKKSGVMRNLDVVNVTVSFEMKRKCVWNDATLLYRTNTSRKHPKSEDMFPDSFSTPFGL